MILDSKKTRDYHFAIAYDKSVYLEWVNRTDLKSFSLNYIYNFDSLKGLNSEQITIHLLDGWRESPVFSNPRDRGFETFQDFIFKGVEIETDLVGEERTRQRDRNLEQLGKNSYFLNQNYSFADKDKQKEEDYDESWLED